MSPQTSGLLGYEFALEDYTGDELVNLIPTYYSEVRNNRSHYVYVGADHVFGRTSRLRCGRARE